MFFSKRRGSAPLLGQLAYLLLNVVFLGCALTLLLVVLWLRQGAMQIYENRRSDLVARAVLKPTISDDQANDLATRLRQRVTDLDIVTIDHTEARAMLALQEPWMRELPDVEIGTLPVMLEMRHPKLLTAPAEVLAFHESVEREPEVSFLMFNQLGYESLVQFGSAVRSYGSLFLIAAALLLLFCHILFNFVISGLRGNISFTKALVNAAGITGLSLVVAVLCYKVIAGIGAKIYPLPTVRIADYVLLATGTFAMVLLLEIKNVRIGRRHIVDLE